MDYERKYKEALERMKSWARGEHPECFTKAQKAAEFVFPELVENEEERIRKSLCKAIWTYMPTEEGQEYIAWLEKQGKQNPNKVEPKFKNGQWIVWQDKCYKVNYNGCGYELVDQNGLSTSLEYGTVDENAHIYDITKDAKPGDVIYLPNGNNEYYFFIFKGIENAAVMPFAHFYQYNDGTFEVKGTIDNLFSVNDVFQPATKEQRDILFQKMKEAGFEWDVEKKEFKIEQKSAWTEDDENMLRTAEQVIFDSDDCSDGTTNKLIDWLKSLKERVQPQSLS